MWIVAHECDSDKIFMAALYFHRYRYVGAMGRKVADKSREQRKLSVPDTMIIYRL